MPKYNLYRIPKKNEEGLLHKLRQVGLRKIGEQDLESWHTSFFFSSKPDEVEIWWVETYRSFLENLETQLLLDFWWKWYLTIQSNQLTEPELLDLWFFSLACYLALEQPREPKNLMHFGVLLISGEKVCYAISLGKAHFYLSQFCHAEFGLKLAERILDSHSLKIKNSKYYKSARSKMITTYQQGSEIHFDSGESMHYIKGKTIDSAKWGSVVSFGASIHLNIDREPSQIIDLIEHVEDVLKKKRRIKLPRVGVEKNESKIKELDKFLARQILSSHSDSEINIEEFTISGVDFVFVDSYKYSIYQKYKSNDALQLTELSMDLLVQFIKDNNINLEEKINDLKIKVHNEYGRGHTKPLKFYLDCIKEDERYCLIDGVWHQFNLSYVNYLKREVDSIVLLDYEPKFDIKYQADDEFHNSEEKFNKDRTSDGYINLDRCLESLDGQYRVEKLDLYKDSVAYFVKKGAPQKLSYVIDQAINTVKILQNDAAKIHIDDQEVEINGICLWMIFDRKTSINKLSGINSIILHMKLVEWKKILMDAKINPLIRINYIIR